MGKTVMREGRRSFVLLTGMTVAMVGLIGSGAAGYDRHLSSEEAPDIVSLPVSALFVMGDSSVDCGDNTLFYTFLHRNFSLHPCNGSDSTLIPNLLAKKMGLPEAPGFYRQNGTIEGLLAGLNFGASQATIMNLGPHPNHQSLDQQLRQAMETFQLLLLRLGQSPASRFIAASLFVVSFGRDDYISFLSSAASPSALGGGGFAGVLVNRLSAALRDLYEAKVRRAVVVGVLPLGCAPHVVWRWRNSTGREGCVGGVNEAVRDYNRRLERRVEELNQEMPDAQLVFCDVYQGMMAAISNHTHYGFEEAREACCGVGWLGGMGGCAASSMACRRWWSHVWWDMYNPSPAVNALLAESAWGGATPLPRICRPVTVHQLLSMSASFPGRV